LATKINPPKPKRGRTRPSLNRPKRNCARAKTGACGAFDNRLIIRQVTDFAKNPRGERGRTLRALSYEIPIPRLFSEF